MGVDTRWLVVGGGVNGIGEVGGNGGVLVNGGVAGFGENTGTSVWVSSVVWEEESSSKPMTTFLFPVVPLEASMDLFLKGTTSFFFKGCILHGLLMNDHLQRSLLPHCYQIPPRLIALLVPPKITSSSSLESVTIGSCTCSASFFSSYSFSSSIEPSSST